MDIKYLAGFFDGEGYVGISTHSCKAIGKKPWIQIRPRATITNTDLRILKQIQEYLVFIGCKSSIRIKSRYNKLHKVGYNLEIEEMKSVHIFLVSIVPYLVIKKDKAENVILHIEGRIKNGKLGNSEYSSSGQYNMFTGFETLN